MTVVTTPPFDVLNPPAVLQLPPTYLDMLFQLNTNSPEDQYMFVQATNGFFYLGLEAKLPSQNQPLEAVRNKVIEDYRQQKAVELVRQAGTNFEAAARDGLAKGMSFDEICAAQKVKPLTLTPFSHETKSIPEISDETEFEDVKALAYQLPTSQVSHFYQTQTAGFVVYVKARAPVDEAIVKRDLPAFLGNQRDLRQSAAFNIWLNREMQMHVIPAAKPAAETQSSSG